MGLRTNDLKNVVSKTVSIDEFEPKIGPLSEIAVLALYVDSADVGRDLTNFLDSTAVDIIDSEVSPAPNENNEYVVFIEMNRDKHFGQKCESILLELEALTGIKINEWLMVLYNKNTQEFSPKKINKQILDVQTQIEPSVVESLRNSYVNTFTVNENKITFNNNLTFTLVDNIPDTLKMDIDSMSMQECKQISNQLVESFAVTKFNGSLFQFINRHTGHVFYLSR